MLDMTKLGVFCVFLISMKIQESPPVKNDDIYWDKIVFFIVVLLFLNAKNKKRFYAYMQLWAKLNKLYQIPDKKFDLSELWY